MMLTLQQAQALVPGSVLVGGGGVAFSRVHSDTRTLRPGDLFVALRGDTFDAHDFLPAAAGAGAVAAIARHGIGGPLPGLQVADPLQALQTLAGAWRERFTLPLVAVAGSNGKTTVTQMVAAILRAAFADAAFATEGNLNNHIGLPLTLLRLRPEHRAGVVELGMNHPGEIALLAAMARPTVALVNNAQREHQEFMATVDAVAQENGSVIAALPADGTAVFPADDAHAPLWRAMAGGRRVVTFATSGAADVSATALWTEAGQGSHWALQLQTPAGSVGCTLRLAGRHNVHNALAAAACALAAGAPLAEVAHGITAFEPVRGRSQAQQIRWQGRPATLVDDSYNANPDSVRAAIEVLASLPGPRWLLLGDMGEVGSRGPEFHAEVGAFAKAQGIDTVWTAGNLSADAAATRHFATVPALLLALRDGPAAASVLVKGSRFMQMERVVQALRTGAP